MRPEELFKFVGDGFFDEKDSRKLYFPDDGLLKSYVSVYEELRRGVDGASKGALLIGGIGSGKTMCMRVMQQIFKDTPRGFLIKKALDFRDMAEEMKPSEIRAAYGAQCKKDLYIDDIGIFDGAYSSFGNKANVIAEIITERYELFVSEGILTHFSTNYVLSADSAKYPEMKTIEIIYGERVADRIKEMCAPIFFTGKSMRK